MRTREIRYRFAPSARPSRPFVFARSVRGEVLSREVGRMAQLTIVRDGLAWSRWNTAGFIIEAALERCGLDDVGAWSKTAEASVFVGTSRECEAVATALEGTGLRIDYARPA